MAKRLIYHNKDKAITYSSFLCKDGVIIYKIIRKDNGYWYLDYNEQDKVFIVTTPKYSSYADVEAYVMQNYEWVLKENKEIDNPRPWMLFGTTLDVQVIIGKVFKYEYLGDKLILYLRNKSEYKFAARKFYREIGTVYMMVRLQELLESLGLKGSFGKCKKFKYCLGQCWCGSNTIDMHSFMMQYSKRIIDGILYHEIAHFTHGNHKKPFWDLLDKYCPDYWERNHEMSKFMFDNCSSHKIWHW